MVHNPGVVCKSEKLEMGPSEIRRLQYMQSSQEAMWLETTALHHDTPHFLSIQLLMPAVSTRPMTDAAVKQIETGCLRMVGFFMQFFGLPSGGYYPSHCVSVGRGGPSGGKKRKR